MMLLHRPNPSHGRPRSSSHPVHPLRVRRQSEANGNAPVRPPRDPTRPVTLGEGQLAPPPPPPAAFMHTPASDGDLREGKISDGDQPSVNVPPPKFLVNRKPPQATPLPQINTLDRKILQELKRSMLARSAQFTLKNNTKHHPFPPDVAPYPRSYDHKCIDTDVWETVFCEQLCGNVTFHTFDVPPTKVLDLGCGSGSWIMACARRWKNCHFVGLDIVPLHPDLGRSELSQRVSWVQANFLEPLPFPNEEFDFVHIKRIARGVPEHKWNALFEEIVRVMKPGAALEMLEEDLYIPGQIIETADNDSPLSAASSSVSSDELSQLHAPSITGPSTSLPGISAEQSDSSSQVTRKSTSTSTSTSHSSRKRRSAGSATSNTLSPHLPIRSTPPSPSNVRPFPLLKPSNSTNRPISSHFNLHNLLTKRSGRDDGTGTNGGQPRKNKIESPVPMPFNKMRRSLSSAGRLPSPKPHLRTTETSSNMMLGSNASSSILPIPTQKPHELGEMDILLTLPSVGNTDGKLEVDFPQSWHNDDPRQARIRSFSCPTPEDDGQRRSTPSREFEPFDLSTVGMHDHARQVRSSNAQNSRNAGVLTDVEPIESNRRGKELTVVLPPSPPKDIPGRSKPQAIPYSSWSNEISGSTTGLSRSVPTEHPERNEGQFLSPTFESMKSLSTSSLAISTNRSTGQVPLSPQNGHSSDTSGAGSAINSPNTDIPSNPRQHRLLEVIYREMHAARLVNLAPLSLLENYIRTYFNNVCTHTPLIFAFPPPPGCEHRPEFDEAGLQGKLSQSQEAEDDDDQDRYLGPDIPPSSRSSTSSLLLAFPPPPDCECRPEFNVVGLRRGKRGRTQEAEDNDSQDRDFGTDTPPSTRSLTAPAFLGPIPPRPTREKSLSVSSNKPGPLRTRSSSTKPIRPAIADPATADHRQPRSRGSKFLVEHGDGVAPDRLVVAGDELLIGASEYVVASGSMIGGVPPARVARAAKESASSASDEREPSRQWNHPLFTHLNDAKGKGESGEALRRLLTPTPKLIRRSTIGSSPPPSLFGYKTPNATSSSSSLPLSIASSSSSITIQHDSGKGKRGLTVAERAELSALPNKKAEVDVRSLNLHLRARVVEILGCSEEMWGWVKEFQSREAEKERKRKEQEALTANTVQGVGGGRVSYYHRDRVRNPRGRERMNSAGSDNSILNRKKSTKGFAVGASKAKHGDDRDDPSEHMEKGVKQELLRMTRVRFDEVLSWFQFDMDDSIRLTHSMTTRTFSSPFPTDPTEQRKSFDDACQKLEAYLQQYPQSPTSFIKPNSVANGCDATSGSSQSSQHCEELCCMPPLLNLVHPSKRLCRTIRVWVAWKS